MTLDQAKRILGPIRCWYSRKQRAWLLEQRPAETKDIIEAAQDRLRQLWEREHGSTNTPA